MKVKDIYHSEWQEQEIRERTENLEAAQRSIQEFREAMASGEKDDGKEAAGSAEMQEENQNNETMSGSATNWAYRKLRSRERILRNEELVKQSEAKPMRFWKKSIPTLDTTEVQQIINKQNVIPRNQIREISHNLSLPTNTNASLIRKSQVMKDIGEEDFEL